jgi:tRNA/rRNA methyltransferase
MTADLSRCRIVLVRPHYPGNVGAVARLMKNYGLTDLVLVDPQCNIESLEARRIATHGLDVLDRARTVPDLPAAIADCIAVLATGGDASSVLRRTVVGPPREKLPFLYLSHFAGPVALVFGPEPHGLSTPEVSLAHGLIHIPTGEAFSSLNLSHAVAICLYELHLLTVEPPASPIGEMGEVAVHADLERMFAHLREAFVAVGFLHGNKADSLMHAVRHVIGRARPTRQEVRILHGLARQLLYVARTADPPPAPGPVIPDGLREESQS